MSKIRIFCILHPSSARFEHFFLLIYFLFIIYLIFFSILTMWFFNFTALALLLHAQLGKQFLNIGYSLCMLIFLFMVRHCIASCVWWINNRFLLYQRLFLHTIMLLHQLGTVQTTPNHLHAQWHRPMPVYTSSVCLCHHKEQQTGHLWVEWCGALQSVQWPEKPVSH